MVRFEEFETKTGGRLDALDITDEVKETVAAAAITNGSALVFSPHTTCSVMIAVAGSETTSALEAAMTALAPEGTYYAHDDLTVRTENLVEDEPANAPAHIFQIMLGKASETLPVIDGNLVLGKRQRVLFVELDSSRKRRYFVQVVGD